MRGIPNDLTVPDPAERARRNAALAAAGTETGLWDDHGRPAPWPDDVELWQPEPARPPPISPANCPSEPLGPEAISGNRLGRGRRGGLITWPLG
jgi:hypothetical protein